ncbi:TPA: hypothetical protein QCU60_004304 [Bacillus cereus]|nr:hypothetical protein [Bacillus cereus]HDR6312318.1 hypothetical protein [Bacillus cereus]
MINREFDIEKYYEDHPELQKKRDQFLEAMKKQQKLIADAQLQQTPDCNFGDVCPVFPYVFDCCRVLVPAGFSANPYNASVAFDPSQLDCCAEPCLIPGFDVPTPCGYIKCPVEINRIRAFGCIPYVVSIPVTNDSCSTSSSANLSCQGDVCVNTITCLSCSPNVCPEFCDTTLYAVFVTDFYTGACGDITIELQVVFQLSKC